MESRTSEWSSPLGGARNFHAIGYSTGNVETANRLSRNVERHVKEIVAAGQAHRATLTCPEKAYERACEIRDRFWECVGGKPATGSLESVKTGEIDGDKYTIEKLIVNVREGAYVPVNLYLPKNQTGKCPAFVVAPGHADDARGYPQYQNVCQTLASNGIIALIFDPLGQGERCEYLNSELQPVFHGCSGEHDHIDWQLKLASWSLARFMAHDCAAFIDYLRSRSDVDTDCIGVTGNSGGGAMTYMSAITSFDKLAFIAPCSINSSLTGMYEYGTDHDNEMIVPGLYRDGIDYADLLCCMAGKPVMMLVNKYDFFAQEAAHETFNEAHKVWERLGHGDELKLEMSLTQHQYTKSLALKMTQYFLSKVRPGVQAEAPVFVERSAKELQVTKCGQIMAEQPAYIPVKTLLRERLKALEAANAVRTEDEKREYVISLINNGRSFPDPGLRITSLSINTIDDIRYDGYLWHSSDNILSGGMLFERVNEPNAPIEVCVWNGGTSKIAEHARLIRRKVYAGHRVLVLDVTGEGALQYNTVACTRPTDIWGANYRLDGIIINYGDSIAAQKLTDVVCAVKAMSEIGEVASVYGENEYALQAQLVSMALGIPCECGGEVISLSETAKSEYYDNTNWDVWALPGILEHLNI